MYQSDSLLSITVDITGEVIVYHDPQNPEHQWLLSIIHPAINKMDSALKWLVKKRRLKLVLGGKDG